MKNTKRKILAATLASSLVFSTLPFAAFADENVAADAAATTPAAVVGTTDSTVGFEPAVAGIAMFAAGGTVDNFVEPDEEHTDGYAWLEQGQLSSQDGSKGNANLGVGWTKYKKNNPLNIATDASAEYRMWKVEAPGAATDYAYVYFHNDTTDETIGYELTITDKADDGMTAYFVVMPVDYRLVGGYAHFKGTGNNFNATYGGHHKAEVQQATVTVSADVEAYAVETTPYENYQYDVHDVYTQDVYDLYTQNVHNLYKYDVQDIYGRYAQRYLVPTFVKKVAADFNDTMVTRLDYKEIAGKKGSTFEATNGGAFNNGHTYVTINAEAAKNGLQFQIADSSKDNGKKNPLKNEYNRPIAPGSEDQKYFYNVKIEDGKLIVSVADGVDWASIGAEAWTTAPSKFNNAPKHYSNSVTLDVPKLDKDGNFALYVHLANLGWYDRDENGEVVYQFKEWKYDDSREEKGEYEKIDTVTGESYFVEKVAEEPVFSNKVYGAPVFKETVTGDEYLVDNGETTEEIPVDLSDVELTLKVDGEDATLGETFTLPAGNHEFVLYANGKEVAHKTVEVKGGEETTVKFDKFHVAEKDSTLETVITREENKIDDVTEYNQLADQINEIWLPDVTEENKLEDQYNEEYVYKEDIKLGNETDYNGEYAIKLN